MNCYKTCQSCDKSCDKMNCRFWLDDDKNLNCTIIAAAKGPMPLQEIGRILNLTRMRICQIEKKIVNKIKLKF